MISTFQKMLDDSAKNAKQVETFRTLHSKGISEDQAINLTEAALIRYFQPQYNIVYKDSFPNYKHSSYSECYGMDVNSISIELDTMYCQNLEIYSKSIPRKHNHMFHYTLHSEEEKRSMFEFFPGVKQPGLQN